MGGTSTCKYVEVGKGLGNEVLLHTHGGQGGRQAEGVSWSKSVRGVEGFQFIKFVTLEVGMEGSMAGGHRTSSRCLTFQPCLQQAGGNTSAPGDLPRQGFLGHFTSLTWNNHETQQFPNFPVLGPLPPLQN